MFCNIHYCTVTLADKVVYATRSNHESENGAVVRRVLEHYKELEPLENNCKLPRFHLKRCTQEEQCHYIALLEAKVYTCHNSMHAWVIDVSHRFGIGIIIYTVEDNLLHT